MCALLLFTFAGAPVSPAGASTPERPVSTTAPQACSLLTSAQLHRLSVLPGVAQPDGSCTWRTIALPPWGGQYVGRLWHGPAPSGTPAPSVNNLPTVEYQPPGLDPRAYCVYLVTVGAGTTLWAQYGGPGQQGITHLVASRRAQALAAAMASTYRAVSR
jgi:hypothetical protein